MLKTIIIQKDEQCRNCGNELPKGSRCHVNWNEEEVFCYGCCVEELGNDRDTF